MDTAVITPHPTLRMIPIAQIQPDPKQPRKHYDADDLNDLAASIAEHGVLQPILVRPMIQDGKVVEWLAPDEDPTDDATWDESAARVRDPVLVIISGERRWRASQQAGKADIPAIVAEHLTDDEIAVIQLIENLQRSDLSTRETVIACANLVERLGLEEAAKRVGKSKPWVSQRSGILKLSAAVQELVSGGHLDCVESAHLIDKIAEFDGEHASEIIDGFINPVNGAAWSRQDLRDALEEHRRRAERIREREAQEQREAALREQQRIETKARQHGLPIDSSVADNLPPPPKSESPHQREQRLRAEAWIERTPECRKLYREARQRLATAMQETVGAPPKEFEIVIGMPDFYTSRDCPAKAAGAEYKIELRGDSTHAGIVLDALKPKHEIGIHIRPTIEQLRAIEKILGQPLTIRETITVRGSVLSSADAAIRRVHASRAQATADDAVEPGMTGNVAAFLRACTQREAGKKIKAAELHAAYVAWCERHELLPIAINDNAWGEAISAAGLKKVRSDGWRYLDIKLLIAEA